jgi:hypothetical protein
MINSLRIPVALPRTQDSYTHRIWDWIWNRESIQILQVYSPSLYWHHTTVCLYRMFKNKCTNWAILFGGLNKIRKCKRILGHVTKTRIIKGLDI